MDYILKAIVSPSLSFVQIVIISYIGALIGEMQKKTDMETTLTIAKFLISWLSSGFGGLIVGLLLQGTIAQNNNYVVLGGAGATGYAGHKYSFGFIFKILNIYVIKTPNMKDTDGNKQEKDKNKGGS